MPVPPLSVDCDAPIAPTWLPDKRGVTDIQWFTPPQRHLIGHTPRSPAHLVASSLMIFLATASTTLWTTRRRRTAALPRRRQRPPAAKLPGDTFLQRPPTPAALETPGRGSAESTREKDRRNEKKKTPRTAPQWESLLAIPPHPPCRPASAPGARGARAGPHSLPGPPPPRRRHQAAPRRLWPSPCAAPGRYRYRPPRRPHRPPASAPEPSRQQHRSRRRRPRRHHSRTAAARRGGGRTPRTATPRAGSGPRAGGAAGRSQRTAARKRRTSLARSLSWTRRSWTWASRRRSWTSTTRQCRTSWPGAWPRARCVESCVVVVGGKQGDG
jgi:hypothetical protein